MLAPVSKGQTAAVHQCSGSSGKWRLVHITWFRCTETRFFILQSWSKCHEN